MKFEYYSPDYFNAGYLDALESSLKTLRGNVSNLIEWRSGATTNLLCNFALKQANPFLLSIDNDIERQSLVAHSLPAYEFLHFKNFTDHDSASCRDNNLLSYARYPLFLRKKFDFALVQGNARLECAVELSHALSGMGIIFFSFWTEGDLPALGKYFDLIETNKYFATLRVRQQTKRLISPCKESRVIIVPVKGKRAISEFKITQPFVEKYAKNISADFVSVGQDSPTHILRLKSDALDVAEKYDRALILDADVLIRSKSPDIFSIVPQDRVGVFPEGRYFSRQDWCNQLEVIYNVDGLISRHYFNSGVIVLSKCHLQLLKALKEEVIYGHPQFEQGFLNVKSLLLNLKTFYLPPEFNYMPDPSFFSLDWRYSFFLHFAGAGKEKYLYRDIWCDTSGDNKTFISKNFMSADIRLNMLRQAAEQLSEKYVYYFDPTDFHYDTTQAVPIKDSKEDIVILFFESSYSFEVEAPSVWGPYTTLEPGHWHLEFKNIDGTNCILQNSEFDITSNCGKQEIVKKSPWTSDGAVKFILEQQAVDVEFRIFSYCKSNHLAYIRLERIASILHT